MSDVVASYRLTQDGVLKILNAAIAKANEIGAPMAIAIVNASGAPLAYFKMDGAKFMAFEAVFKKARTAAFLKKPTGHMAPEILPALNAAITDFTNLHGGVPLIYDGEVVGGLGAGSGTLEEDGLVAQAGAAALAQA